MREVVPLHDCKRENEYLQWNECLGQVILICRCMKVGSGF